jgi:hypothetical protein
VSIKIMTLVFEAYGLTPNEKVVALSLADQAHDDGTEARPGIARIAKKSGMSTRTAQRTIAQLIDKGIIKIERYENQGRHQPRWYRFDVTNRGYLRKHQWSEDDLRGDNLSPVTKSVQPLTERAPRGDNVGVVTIHRTIHIEPSETHSENIPDSRAMAAEARHLISPGYRKPKESC